MLDDAADVADVLTRGELRHDAAPLAVYRYLRGHHVRPNAPRPSGVTRFIDDGGRGLIAGGFDSQNQHDGSV
jgi:hypothetical protein